MNGRGRREGGREGGKVISGVNVPPNVEGSWIGLQRERSTENFG